MSRNYFQQEESKAGHPGQQQREIVLARRHFDPNPPEYDSRRYQEIERVFTDVRFKHSVKDIDTLLSLILCLSDFRNLLTKAESHLISSDEVGKCIQTKFSLVTKLAKTLNLTSEELLGLTDEKTLSNITEMLYCHVPSINFLQSILECSQEFSRKFFQDKVWYDFITKNRSYELPSFETVIGLQTQLQLPTFFDKTAVIKSFHYILSDISFNDPASGNSNLTKILEFFSIPVKQLTQLYREPSGSLKSKCLEQLMLKLQLPREYRLDEIVARRFERSQTHFDRLYPASDYYDRNFFNKNEESLNDIPDNGYKKVFAALSYLTENFSVEKQSHPFNPPKIPLKEQILRRLAEHQLSLLDILTGFTDQLLDKNKFSAAERNSHIYGLTRIVLLILNKQIFQALEHHEKGVPNDNNEELQKAMTVKTLEICSAAAQDPEMAKTAMYGLHLILNRTGLRRIFEKFRLLARITSLALTVFDQTDDKEVKRFCTKIFEYYFSTEKYPNLETFKREECYLDIQFVCTRKFAKDKNLAPCIKNVHDLFYFNETWIKFSLTKFIRGLANSDDGVFLHSLQYVQELLECDEHQLIRDYLTRSAILTGLLCETLLEIMNNRDFNGNNQIMKCCARISGAMGTKMGEIWTKAVDSSIESMTSERTAELIKYRDNWMEFTRFLQNILSKNNDFETTGLQKSLYLLQNLISCSQSIKPSTMDRIIVELLNDSIVAERSIQVEVLPQQIDKNKALATLTYYLIWKMNNNSVKTAFQACIPLLVQSADTAGQKAIHLLLPYITYQTIRLSNCAALTNQIANYLNLMLQSSKQELIKAVFKILDFLLLCKREHEVQKDPKQDANSTLKDRLFAERIEELVQITNQSTHEIASKCDDLKRELFSLEKAALKDKSFIEDQHSIKQSNEYKKSQEIARKLAPEDFQQPKQDSSEKSWIQIKDLAQAFVDGNYLEDTDNIPKSQIKGITDFKQRLAFIFAQLYRAKQFFLSQAEENDYYNEYEKAWKEAIHRLDTLSIEIILSYRQQLGNHQLLSLLYLSVLYEIESALMLTNGFFNKNVSAIRQVLKQGNCTLQAIYNSLNLSPIFEQLQNFFEHRTYDVEMSSEFTQLMLEVRRVVFDLYDRTIQRDQVVVQLVSHYRKQLGCNVYDPKFKLVEEYLGMLDQSECIFELEKAKVTYLKEQDDAMDYIDSILETIKEKVEKLNPKKAQKPDHLYLKAKFLQLEWNVKSKLEICPVVVTQKELVKLIKFANVQLYPLPQMQKKFYIVASFLDQLMQAPDLPNEDKGNMQIVLIQQYMNCISKGNKYLSICLPRAIDLMFFQPIYPQLEQTKKRVMTEALNKLQLYQIASVVHILLTYLSTTNHKQLLLQQFNKLLFAYPYQTFWQLMCKDQIFFTNRLTTNSPKDQDFLKCMNLLNELRTQAKKEINYKNPKLPQSLIEAAKDSPLVIPTLENLTPRIPCLKPRKTHLVLPIVQTNLKYGLQQTNAPVKYQDEYLVNQVSQSVYKRKPARIKEIKQELTVFDSLDRPQKIVFIGTDGKEWNFLLKKEQLYWKDPITGANTKQEALDGFSRDFTKEQRIVMSLARAFNEILAHDQEALSRNLQLRTNAILALDYGCGLIQFFENADTVSAILDEEYKQRQTRFDKDWSQLWKEVPPVLSCWYEKNFPSPEQRYASRQRLIKSAALWAIFGFVIGLGDRHFKNMLIDKKTGELLHIDFDCTFEKGQTLGVPELVPFRHTRNLEHAYGLHGEVSTFTKCAQIALRALRENETLFLQHVKSFLIDKLLDAKRNEMDFSKRYERFKDKLSGKKQSGNQHLSVEEQVQILIRQAKDKGNLQNMFSGWESYK